MNNESHTCTPPVALRDAPDRTVWTCHCGRRRRVEDHNGRRWVVELLTEARSRSEWLRAGSQVAQQQTLTRATRTRRSRPDQRRHQPTARRNAGHVSAPDRDRMGIIEQSTQAARGAAPAEQESRDVSSAEKPRDGTGRERRGDLYSSPETADRVLDWLRDRADPSGEVVAGLRVLSDELGVAHMTARRALRLLEDERRVVLLRRGTSRGYGSRYRLVAHIPEQTGPAARPVA